MPTLMRLLVAGLCAASALALQAQTPVSSVPSIDEAAPAGEPGRALHDLDRYPVLSGAAQAHYLSSYDRTGGNDDGFRGTYSALYVDERGEHVIFDQAGPGIVYTMWFTSREHGWADLGWGRIRFYFDGETEPRLDADVDELFAGERPPFVAPFVSGPFESTGGHVSYVPLPFATRLKITTERRAGFYNVHYHRLDGSRPVSSWTGREYLSAAAAAWRQAGSPPLPRASSVRRSGLAQPPVPLQPDGDMVPTEVELVDWAGAGAVTALRVNPLFPLTAYQLRHLRLRIFWDGQREPAVDAPLGPFFGSGLGEAAVRALPLGMSESGAYYCYWPMPFWSRVRVTLVNENPDPVPQIRYEVEIAPADSLAYDPERTGYFHATERRSWPTPPGGDHELLATEGRGRYLGQVMTVEPIRSEVKRWWEGDLRIWIDGRRHPALQGTGHEDEYLGGWSNEWLMNPYSLPLHGEPRTANLVPVDFQWNAATTVYRFFVGGLPYESGLRAATEHGARNEVGAMYSSVAFYYQQARPGLRLDALDVGDAADEARHEYRAEPAGAPLELTSRFEASGALAPLADRGRDVERGSRFVMRVPQGASRLRLRRLFDQSRRQAAEVWVNGQRAGAWVATATNTEQRWADDDLLLPAGVMGGSTTLRFEIRVQEGPWSEFRYELWGADAR
jgi:hypothetical protein